MRETKATWIFLLLTFAISWTVAEVGFRLVPPGAGAMVVIGIPFMFGPALAALVTTRVYLRRPLSWLGPMWKWNRWLFAAIGFPLLFTIAWLLVATALPALQLNSDSASLSSTLLKQVPPAQHEAVAEKLTALGDWLLPLLLLQLLVGGLIAGTTVNAIAAFGEELGWRGFLHRTLADRGFWQRAWFIGFFWGIWHWPMLVRGHNFPHHPGWGVPVMVMFCLLLSPLFEYLRTRSGGLLAPVWMHGVLNALGGAALLVEGSDLLRGPAGLAGLLVLAACNLLLWRHLRKAHASEHAIALQQGVAR